MAEAKVKSNLENRAFQEMKKAAVERLQGKSMEQFLSGTGKPGTDDTNYLPFLGITREAGRMAYSAAAALP